MRYISACFGADFKVPARGLIRSFSEWVPEGDLTVFTDQPLVGGPGVRIDNRVSLDDLKKEVPSSSTVCVIKAGLFLRVLRDRPDVCWLDCDALIQDDLSHHVLPGWFNTVTIEKGAGIFKWFGGHMVDPATYVIGGTYSLPSLELARELLELVREREGWADKHQTYEDQGLVNLLALSHPGLVRRVDRASDRIFNFAWGGHPRVDNTAFSKIRFDGQGLTWEDRKFGVLFWTAPTLKEQLRLGFPNLAPSVRAEMKRLYT